MTDPRNGLRYVRTTGSTILAPLLLMASHGVVQPTPVFASPSAVQAVPQEISPEDRAAIEAGPVNTPYLSARPELKNRDEVIQALVREYPPALRDTGVGGRVAIWLYLSDSGQVLHATIAESSGQADLDGRPSGSLSSTNSRPRWMEPGRSPPGSGFQSPFG